MLLNIKKKIGKIKKLINVILKGWKEKTDNDPSKKGIMKTNIFLLLRILLSILFNQMKKFIF